VVKREKNGRLTPECRLQLATINLRFHDLRREAGSKFLEGGMDARGSRAVRTDSED
jgi:hypothetical protein